MPTPPWFIRVPFLIAAAASTALFGWSLYAATLGTPATVWAALGFSLIGLVSAGFAVALGLGKFTRGFGIAGLCVAGAVLTCGVLGWLDLRANLASTPELARLLRPWLLGTAVVGLGLAGCSGLAVLLRSAKSWKYVGFGSIALAATGGLLAIFRGPGQGLLTRWEDGPEAVRVALLLAAAFLGLVLVSAAGHLLIRAFEVTTSNGAHTPETPSPDPAGS